MKSFAVSGFTAVAVLYLCLAGCQGPDSTAEKFNLLILTGRNNHDWAKTTAVLDSILMETGLFSVDVTMEPETLTSGDFAKYHALLSNWNSWPENDARWPEETEKGLLEFVEEGGGLIFFHSSTSAFYTWPEFKQITTAAWIMDSTWHGPISRVRVTIRDREHPITGGLNDFYILDELWIDAGQNASFKVLGVAENTEGDSTEQPAIMVGHYGKGRIFHTILGHDVTALRSPGFQSLLSRAAEWASSGRVSGSGLP